MPRRRCRPCSRADGAVGRPLQKQQIAARFGAGVYGYGFSVRRIGLDVQHVVATKATTAPAECRRSTARPHWSTALLKERRLRETAGMAVQVAVGRGCAAGKVGVAAGARVGAVVGGAGTGVGDGVARDRQALVIQSATNRMPAKTNGGRRR